MDYKTVVFDGIYGLVLFIIINFIFNNNTIKIYLFIVLYFPIILFSFFGANEENIIDVLIYVIKYIKSQKIILYNRKN